MFWVSILSWRHSRLPRRDSRGLEERLTDPLAPIVRVDAKVPQNGQVHAVLEHIDCVRRERKHGAADQLAVDDARYHPPAGDIEASGPVAGALPSIES